MSTISADKTFYSFPLELRENSLMRSINFHTNRADVSKNRLTLSIYAKYMNPGSFLLAQTCVENLTKFGARLVTVALAPNIPFSIEIPDYSQARPFVQYLQLSKLMSTEVASQVGAVLNEMEQDVDFASHTDDSITPAQRDVIKSMILPYVESIKIEAGSDIEIIEDWIKMAVNKLNMFGPGEDLRKSFERSARLDESDKTLLEKGAQFFEDLAAVAKVYGSIGDLEGTFLQQGPGKIPSRQILQEVVVSCFKE